MRNIQEKVMKKIFISIILMLAIPAFGFASCSDNEDPPYNPDGIDIPTEFTIQMTTAIPGQYLSAATEQGTVEVVEYESKDYTSASLPVTHKPAYVYLPYGYDAMQKYDIIYLIHGWSGVAEGYFGRPNNQQMKNLFDNMIQQGLCKPFIAVSPTWDKDNRSKGWSESVGEIAVFHNEYENELIPAVEGRYSTYAETTDRAGIIASRDHRAFGGFSLGAVTTWYAFEHTFDLQRYFLPMSGDSWHIRMYGGQYEPEATAAFLASVVNASESGGDNFHVWHAVGTSDSRFYQTHNQALACMNLTDTFTSANFSYYQKDDGYHDFNAVYEFCYNALPSFFPLDQSTNIENAIGMESKVSAFFNSANQLIVNNLPDGNNNLAIYSAAGILVHKTTINSNSATIDMNNMSNGIYIARVNDQAIKFVRP